MTPSRYRANLERLDALCAEAGRDPARLERALLVFVALGPDRETAVRRAGGELTRIYNQPFDQVVERYCVVGTPDDCAARIAEFQAAGVRHFVFNWACPQGEILEQMERPALTALDTMNFWIEGKRADLLRVLARVDVLLINDAEARMLAGEPNLIKAARTIGCPLTITFSVLVRSKRIDLPYRLSVMLSTHAGETRTLSAICKTLKACEPSTRGSN